MSSTRNFSSWLQSNQLHDLVPKIGHAIALAGLLNLDEQNLRSILGIYGLNTNEMNILITALEREKNKSSQPGIDGDYGVYPNLNQTYWDTQDEYDFINDDDIKDNGEFPVWPLIIPNNCKYNKDTGKMTVYHDQPRDKLVPYKPALDFIRSIKSKVATISIVGRARTGKSLVAGELYAPGHVPCPFDLGHKMDACTYGIWVSAKTIKHPHEDDTVVLIIDVEGTGFHQASKQNDMQLMVITLLISSYFIYNSKGSFDAPALDEIKFVTELTEKIQATPNDDSGDEFKKFFPIFMWLLRDVHLEPVINNKQVTIREYFTQKVLKREKGFNKSVQERQWIRQVFMQMFQKYDAFTLPMPHAKPQVLKKIGILPRNQLVKEFVDGLQELTDKIMRETTAKVLFNKKPDGTDDYIICTGSHLAGWIETCIDAVNDPNKIPEISSMTESVMANVYRNAKSKAIEEYKQLLTDGLNKLRNNDEKQPLEEKGIIDLHLNVFNSVLNSSGKSLHVKEEDYKNYDNDDQKNNSVLHQQQIKIFFEFCDEIGHNTKDIQKMGNKGILYQILTVNSTLSSDFCDKWLNYQFDAIIEPLLQNPENEAEFVMAKVQELERNFFAECKGPAKEDCWQQFKTKRFQQSLKHFKNLKGFNTKLVKMEQEAAQQREQARILQQQLNQSRIEMQQQQRMMQDQINRSEALRKEQEKELKKQIAAANQRCKDMEDTNFKNMEQAMANQRADMMKEQKRMQEKHTRELNATTARMQKSIDGLKNRPPKIIYQDTGGGKKGGCFGSNNTCYRRRKDEGDEECKVNEVKLGDYLLTENGEYECVFHVDHYKEKMDMICIQHGKGNIIMTEHHYVYIQNRNDIDDVECIMASDVKIGDNVKYMNNNDNSEWIKVTNILHCSEYATTIMTTNGTVVISNIAASCFTLNTMNLKKYLWISQIVIDYAPIKCAQIIADGFYYTNKYFKWMKQVCNDYIMKLE